MLAIQDHNNGLGMENVMATSVSGRIFILLASAPILAAQVDRANLTGTISDPVGAAIPHATAEVSYTGTGFTRIVETGDTGTYSVPALPLGRCSVNVAVNGFQTQQIENLILAVGETRTLNFQL